MKLTRSGFIKPDGKFVCVNRQEHENYLRKHKLDGKHLGGWIKVSESFMGVYIFREFIWNRWHIGEELSATQAQLDTLFLWAKKFDHMKDYQRFLEGEEY